MTEIAPKKHEHWTQPMTNVFVQMPKPKGHKIFGTHMSHIRDMLHFP